MTAREALRLAADRAYLREAIVFTAAEEGFAARLVEKDFFASVLLAHLASRVSGLVFRGGTFLAKVELGFFRLSEDLDFAISMPVEVARSVRSARALPVKEAILSLESELGCFRIERPLAGADESRQYAAEVRYRSCLAEVEESLLVEVGLREPLLLPAVRAAARTLLRDPISGAAALAPLPVEGMHRDEAWAEKLRAALSRREPAIRDFFDVDHAVRRGDLQLERASFVEAVRAKLGVPGNAAPDLSPERLAELRRQVEPRLRPVLREQDFAAFELDRAFRQVAELGRRVRER